ncbi:autotransporter domain-containing protein [Stenotrophomonas sp. NA06056]|uniref:autotransporter domain-containing protein n=1 Tax=Stenotrophomonas sp. NA06056 TaxID=2742129 RepID=UPI00158DB143|nr:autotransporter domain-containing protein [Stenotrophomonas sp. NA06056]QKW56373.1 autotransporter domain-containing protein [Stenotrophomonas sp. NA06056]
MFGFFERNGAGALGRKSVVVPLLALVFLILCSLAPASSQAAVPDAPTVTSVSTSGGSAATPASVVVGFSAPGNTGGSQILDYTVTSSPEGLIATGAASPITVNGLTRGTTYTFTVTARNADGDSPASMPSPPITPQITQYITFNNPGSLNFGTTTPLVASSTSGLPVQLDSQTVNICDIVNGNQLRAKAPGSCTVVARQAGNGTYHPAMDVTQSFQITIPGGAVTIATTSLPSPTRGVPYSQTLIAQGGAQPYTFTITGGALPNGLVLNPAGLISGTTTGSGTYPFTVQVQDQAGQTATRTFVLNIITPSFVFTPLTLSNGQVGAAYPSTTLSVTGGINPYSFAITGGSLPAGLVLSTTGVLSGTPTSAGPATFTVTATDSFGATGQQAYTINLAQPVPIAVDDAATVAANGSVTLDVTGNDSGPISQLAITQAPAHGSAVVAGTRITYTPTQNYFGTDTLQYTATGPGGTSTPATVTVTVSAGPAPVAATQTATVLAGTTVTLKAADGASNGPFTAAAIVTAPATGSVQVQGTDLRYTAAADFNGVVTFDYTLSNAFGASQPARVTLTVNPAPVVAAVAASALAGQSVQINLSRTARGGPFTAANVLSVAPATAGSARVQSTPDGYVLSFEAASSFGGTALISYTLSNAYATSAAGTVTVTVTPRSDPSQDAEVRGILSAQADATRRMALGQINNFQRRLEQLHSGDGTGFSNGITLGSARAARQPARNTMPQDLQDASRRYLLQADAQSPATPFAAGLPPDGLLGEWSLWTGGALNFGTAGGGGRDSGTDFTTSGLSLGADRAISGQLSVGGGIGYGHDSSDIGNKGSRSTVDSYSAALYASYRPSDAVFIDALLGYQWLSLDSRRHVTDSGGQVQGSRDGTQWFGSLSTGYRFIGKALVFTPYARLDAARARLDGFTEQGDAVYVLAYQAQTVTLSTATVGALARWAIKRDEAVWSPQLRAEFGHDLQGAQDARLGYADLPGGPLYRTTLYGQSRNHGLLGAGIGLRTASDWMLRAEYQVRLDNSSGNDQSVLLGVEKAFGR